jgi:hypothetical protein
MGCNPPLVEFAYYIVPPAYLTSSVCYMGNCDPSIVNSLYGDCHGSSVPFFFLINKYIDSGRLGPLEGEGGGGADYIR